MPGHVGFSNKQAPTIAQAVKALSATIVGIPLKPFRNGAGARDKGYDIDDNGGEIAAIRP